MKDLHVGEVVDINDLKIIPVEEVRIFNRYIKSSTAVYAAKKPFAIIIREENRTRVFSIDNRDFTLDFLISEVKGLKEILNN